MLENIGGKYYDLLPVQRTLHRIAGSPVRKKIFYNDQEIASWATMRGGSDMSIVVTENGEPVTYEWTTKVGFFKDMFIVCRNGIMIYSE